MTYIYIEPAREHRRAFARWCLDQTPKIQAATATGSNVPVDLYPSLPVALLEGAFVDGYRYVGQVTPAPSSPARPRLVAEGAPAPKRRAKRKPKAVKAPESAPQPEAPVGGAPADESAPEAVSEAAVADADV